MTVASSPKSVVEEAALGGIAALGYASLPGPEIAVGQPGVGRADLGYSDAVRERRLR